MDRANSIFDQIDKDKSGGIDKDELLFHLLELGQEYETISDMFARLDTDNDGLISRQEFVDGFEKYQAFCRATAEKSQAALKPPPPHFGPEALLASVESGAIAPLRGSWLVRLEADGGRVQRRQDLPPEAFFPADELRRLVEALGDDYGLLFVGLS